MHDSKVLTIEDTKEQLYLHLYCIGGNYGDVILFEGDFGMHHAYWRPVMQNLSYMNYTLCSYDRPGYLFSSRLNYTSVFESIFASLNIIMQEWNRSIMIVGKGYGALLSSLYASKFPQHVKALLLIDPIQDVNLENLKKSNLKSKYLSQFGLMRWITFIQQYTSSYILPFNEHLFTREKKDEVFIYSWNNHHYWEVVNNEINSIEEGLEKLKNVKLQIPIHIIHTTQNIGLYETLSEKSKIQKVEEGFTDDIASLVSPFVE